MLLIKKAIPVVISLAALNCAAAGSYYECDIQGRKTFQSSPCPGDLGTSKDQSEQYLENERKRNEELKRQEEQAALEIKIETERRERERATRLNLLKAKTEKQMQAVTYTANLLSMPHKTTEEIFRNAEQEISLSSKNASFICRQEWLDQASPDYRMYEFCKSEQEKAALNASDLISKKPESKYYPSSIIYCWREWQKHGLINPRMALHCIKQEKEAWMDIQYLSSRFDKSSISKIAEYGFKKYGSWNMAAYHARKTLKID